MNPEKGVESYKTLVYAVIHLRIPKRELKVLLLEPPKKLYGAESRKGS